MNNTQDKDPLSFQYDNCFTSDELLAYKIGGLEPKKRSLIFHHLNVDRCKRCRVMFSLVEPAPHAKGPENLKEKMIQRLKRTAPLGRRFESPASLEVGQIWTTSPEVRDASGRLIRKVNAAFPVVIVSKGRGNRAFDNIIRVIPISFDTHYHLDGETLLIDQESPLMYPFLLELFNECPMLAGNLDEYRGALSSGDIKRLFLARQRFLEGRTTLPDKTYIAWKEREIQYFQYLSFPVNDALFGDQEGRNVLEIPLNDYRKAAEAEGLELSELSLYTLVDTPEFCLAVVQARDRVLLRLSYYEDDGGPPEMLTINNDTASMIRAAPCVYEVLLGYVDALSGEIKVAGKVLDSEFQCTIYFKKIDPDQ